MGLFHLSHGIIPACDMSSLDDFSELVKSTANLPFIAGYKVGMVLGLSKSLEKVVETVRRFTSLPVIYDHQKFGTDVPEICSGEVIQIFKQAGINAVIIFPQAGPITLGATVKALRNVGIEPIVGGEMTHNGYLEKEGGYMSDLGPARMYADGASNRVEYFVVPGTRLESMALYGSQLGQLIAEPKFLFPGIGRGQGGDIVEAFRRVAPFPSFAIVGRGIYAERDRTSAAERLWEAVKSAGLNI